MILFQIEITLFRKSLKNSIFVFKIPLPHSSYYFVRLIPVLIFHTNFFVFEKLLFLLELFRVKITELVSIIEFAIFPSIRPSVFSEIVGSDDSSEERSIFREYDRNIFVQ